MGIPEEEFWGMLPRDFFRRVDAHRQRAEREVQTLWLHVTLPVINHLRDVINVQINTTPGVKRKSKIPPVKPSALGVEVGGADGGGGPMSREEYEEMKAHFRWLREHGTRRLLN